jgi:hypothetical protein
MGRFISGDHQDDVQSITSTMLTPPRMPGEASGCKLPLDGATGRFHHVKITRLPTYRMMVTKPATVCSSWSMASCMSAR